MKKTIQMLAIVAAIMLCFILFPSPVSEAEIYIEPTEVIIPTDAEPEEVEPYFTLTAEERELVERVVAAEARGESIECQMAVAQTILDRAVSREQSITKVCTAPYQFAEPYQGEVSEKTQDAVFLVFDNGAKVFDKVTHFYAHKLIDPPYWTELKEFKGELGGVRFYADKED